MANELGYENVKTFDKKDLMKSIYSEYNVNREQNSAGEYIYENDDFIED
jgi:hypothetical protein